MSQLAEIGLGLRAILPVGWTIHEDDGTIEIEPPDGDGAVHITVLRRTASRNPSTEEARRFIQVFPAWNNARHQGVILETSLPSSRIAAYGSCSAADGRLWDVGALIGRDRGLLFSYNHLGTSNVETELARKIFWSIDGLSN